MSPLHHDADREPFAVVSRFPTLFCGRGELFVRLPRPGASAVAFTLLPLVACSDCKQWTDSGKTQDDRGLKNRSTEDVRQCPFRPTSWPCRRAPGHLGTADDGRLFFSEKRSVVPSSTYYRAWQEARLLALPPAIASSPLASRPYDPRHSALSTWLNAGVGPTEVAERAGNSVEVLLTCYAKCLDGRQDVANRRIEALLLHGLVRRWCWPTGAVGSCEVTTGSLSSPISHI
jgi:hypothetical protein